MAITTGINCPTCAKKKVENALLTDPPDSTMYCLKGHRFAHSEAPTPPSTADLDVVAKEQIAKDATQPKWNVPMTLVNGDILFTVRIPEYYATNLKAEAELKQMAVEDYFQHAVELGVGYDWFLNW